MQHLVCAARAVKHRSANLDQGGLVTESYKNQLSVPNCDSDHSFDAVCPGGNLSCDSYHSSPNRVKKNRGSRLCVLF